MQNFKNCLCRIRDLQHQIASFEKELETQFGVSLNEGMVLCSISSAGSLTCGAIAQMLAITPSNCSKVISKVESKGLISRTLGKEDKREMIFQLTHEGMSLLERINSSEISLSDVLK